MMSPSQSPTENVPATNSSCVSLSEADKANFQRLFAKIKCSLQARGELGGSSSFDKPSSKSFESSSLAADKLPEKEDDVSKQTHKVGDEARNESGDENADDKSPKIHTETQYQPNVPCFTHWNASRMLHQDKALCGKRALSSWKQDFGCADERFSLGFQGMQAKVWTQEEKDSLLAFADKWIPSTKRQKKC